MIVSCSNRTHAIFFPVTNFFVCLHSSSGSMSSNDTRTLSSVAQSLRQAVRKSYLLTSRHLVLVPILPCAAEEKLRHFTTVTLIMFGGRERGGVCVCVCFHSVYLRCKIQKRSLKNTGRATQN